jgi:hypothetical protein
MSTENNIKLTPNFWLYEFIEASPSNNQQFKNIAWKNIGEFNADNVIRLAQFLQSKRDYVNNMFRAENSGREIGLKITSAFRPVEWELLQKRSGNSRHTKTDAADIQPINCTPTLAVKIMKHLESIDSPLDTGHQGGFAVKHPTYDKKGNIQLIGFLHYDLRGTVARWTY